MIKELQESVPELVKVESEDDILSRVRKNPKFGEKEGLKIGRNFTLTVSKIVLKLNNCNLRMKINPLSYGL